jgi:hypothetical protein
MPTVPRRRIAALALALVLGGGACIHTIEEQTSSAGRVVRDCVVPAPPDLAALGAPVSLEYPDGSLWIWSVLARPDQSLVTNASAMVASAAEVCASGPALRRGADGSIASLLALDDAEVAANATRTDGKHRWLSPTGGFVHDGRGYLYYEHEEGTGFLDSSSVGTGLCVIDAGAETCRRVEVGGSTVLWPDGQPALDQGGLLVGGDAFVYGCRSVADFDRICTASGVPSASAEEPGAYQYLNVNKGWVNDPLSATVLTTDLGPITVSDYAGGYIATTLDPFDGGVYIRRMSTAFEVFDRRIYAFTIAPTQAAFPSGGREHRALRGSSLEIDVSYAVEDAGATKLHLATFQFLGSETGRPAQPGVNGEAP